MARSSMHVLLPLAATALASCATEPQPAGVRGTVTSAATAAPVAGARVAITRCYFGGPTCIDLAADSSDLAGRFVLTLQVPISDSAACGLTTFSASAAGYATYLASLAAVGTPGDACDGRAAGVAIALTPSGSAGAVQFVR